MNRKLMLGIACFLAIIGAAVVGMENEASAGRGCGGGLFARLHARKAACDGPADCGTPAPPPPPACAGAPDCAAPSCGGGGFLARLRAKHAERKAARKADCGKPADCGTPAPPPEPCCEPAPEPCCEPAPEPAPCCAVAAPVVSEVIAAPVSTPCCGMISEPIINAAPIVESVPMATPCCGGEIMMGGSEIMMDGGVVYDSSPSDYYGGGVSGAIMVNEAGEEIVPGSVQVIDDGSGEAAAEAAVEVAPEASDEGI